MCLVGGEMEKLIKIGQAARLLGVDPGTIRAWEKRGIVKGFRRLGHLGPRYFSVDEINKMCPMTVRPLKKRIK